MKKLVQQLLLSGLLAMALTGAYTANAKKTNDTETAPAPKVKRDWYPFHGIVAAVDTKAKTISLKKTEGERVLKIDSKTELQSAGKPATLSDVKVGEYAHGKLHKDVSGAEVITSAKFDKEAPVKKEKTDDSKPPKKSAVTN